MSIPVYENENLGIAGCMIIEGEETIIYSNPETGAFLYFEENSGLNMEIGGVSDRTAKQSMNKDTLFKAVSTGSYGEDAVGVIFCEKHIIVMTSDSSCEVRPYNATKLPSERKFEIVLGIDAEE